jgi:hypothetical protein
MNSAAFRVMPSIHFQKVSEEQGGSIGNQQHLVPMIGNESLTTNCPIIRFTFPYPLRRTDQIFYSSYVSILMMKHCLLVLFVKSLEL